MVTSAPAHAARVEVVRVTDEHLAALSTFFQRVWDPDATAERVRAARRLAARTNCAEPGVEPPTFLMLVDGEVVGHVTTIPARLWAGGELHPLYWIKGLMVLPEHRNGPVGFMVLREAVRALDAGMAMVVQPNARKLFQSLGFSDLGVLPDFVRPLRSTEVLRGLDPSLLATEGSWRRALAVAGWLQRTPLVRLAGAGASAALGCWSAWRGRPGSYRVGAPDAPTRVTFDRLWERMRVRLPAAPARDADGMAVRYGPGRSASHRVVEVRRGEGVEAAIVLRAPRTNGDARLNGIRVAVLSEVICDPENRPALLAAVAAAEHEARALGADLLLCGASDPRLQQALRDRAFLAVPGAIHLLVREGSKALDLPRDLSRWWCTRGDSAADEVF